MIPASRSVRELQVMVPSAPTPAPHFTTQTGDINLESPPADVPVTSSFTFSAPQLDGLTIPSSSSTVSSPNFSPQNSMIRSQISKAYIQSDGLLLYVAEASYEHGTSPLSSWVPLSAYERKEYERIEHGSAEALNQKVSNHTIEEKESPLDCFHR